jgi:hypothetical protein
MKLLDELDRTVFAIADCFAFSEGTADFVLTRAAKARDQHIARNVVLNPEQTSDLFANDSRSFEFRIHKPLIINVDYLSPGVADDGLFDQEGAVLIPGQGIKLAFPRGPGKLTHNEMFDWPKQEPKQRDRHTPPGSRRTRKRSQNSMDDD